LIIGELSGRTGYAATAPEQTLTPIAIFQVGTHWANMTASRLHNSADQHGRFSAPRSCLSCVVASVLIVGCREVARPLPQRQVIQICDWHYLPQESFAADLRSDDEHSDAEIDRLYAEHLNDVEAARKSKLSNCGG